MKYVILVALLNAAAAQQNTATSPTRLFIEERIVGARNVSLEVTRGV